MSKRVLFIANSLDNAYKFRNVLANLEVEVSACSTLQVKSAFLQHADEGCRIDAIVFEGTGPEHGGFDEVASFAEDNGCALLVIVDGSTVGGLSLPASNRCDFVMADAVQEECIVRLRRLLGEGAGEQRAEIITVDNMTMNLATYQVTVAGKPVDFTYLEYELLVYLVQHPKRTFSRDVLLHNVWGIDYYGGTRTVDVHVRRIRSKLGPGLAEHLDTVRGVGYLWK